VDRSRAIEKSQHAELTSAVSGRRRSDLPTISNARHLRSISASRISYPGCFAIEQFQIRHFSRQVHFAAFSPIFFVAEKLLNQIQKRHMRGLTTCPYYRA